MNLPRKYHLSFLLFGLLFVAAAVVIWVRISTVKDSYQHVKKQRELKNLERQIQDQRMILLQLTSPARLHDLSEDLGLQPPLAKKNLTMNHEKLGAQ